MAGVHISICLEMHSCLLFVFFFWKILKITMVADVEENSVPGEQKWRETFPYLTLLTLKLWELETKN